EVLVLRAEAYRRVEAPELALDDLERVLALEPENAEALMQRGLVRFEMGDPEAARQDWRRVVELAPESEAGAAARQNLQQMEQQDGGRGPAGSAITNPVPSLRAGGSQGSFWKEGQSSRASSRGGVSRRRDPGRLTNGPDRGREGFRLPALRTARAVFPHTALQSVVSSSGMSRALPSRV